VAFALTLNKSHSSLSALIPFQEKFKVRSCITQEYFQMLEWFEAVEFLAWEKVNKYWPGNRRPQRIFCVTGQTLSSTYAIAHSASSSAECLVTLEAKGGFPDVADAEIIANYKIDKAHATYGFQKKKEDLGDEEYVLFLDLRWSGPMRSFRHVHLQRLKELYRCTTAKHFHY
jgi:hypothetical protein